MVDDASRAREESAEFWTARYSGRVSLRLAGDASLGGGYNRMLYVRMRHVVAGVLSRAGVRIRGASVLDAGAGTGGWIPLWRRHGSRDVTGIDIAPGAVAESRRRYPEARFIQGDLADPGLCELDGLRGRTFDVVSAIGVLFHLTTEEALSQGLANLAALTAPRGCVVLSDGMQRSGWSPAGYEVHRPLSTYMTQLNALGFECIALEPLVVVMVPPIGPATDLPGRIGATGARLLRFFARKRWTEPLNLPLGMLLWCCDLGLRRFISRGPTWNLLVARKISA